MPSPALPRDQSPVRRREAPIGAGAPRALSILQRAGLAEHFPAVVAALLPEAGPQLGLRLVQLFALLKPLDLPQLLLLWHSCAELGYDMPIGALLSESAAVGSDRLDALACLEQQTRWRAAQQRAQWLTVYMRLALDCDTPIAEALQPSCSIDARRAVLKGPMWQASLFWPKCWPKCLFQVGDRDGVLTLSKKTIGACAALQHRFRRATALLRHLWACPTGHTLEPLVTRTASMCVLELLLADAYAAPPAEIIEQHAQQILKRYAQDPIFFENPLLRNPSLNGWELQCALERWRSVHQQVTLAQQALKNSGERVWQALTRGCAHCGATTARRYRFSPQHNARVCNACGRRNQLV